VTAGRSGSRFGCTVELPHPPDAVFAYLADPRNRPEWQSSLLSVRLDDVGAQPHVGMAWTETTVVGLRAAMAITELEPCRLIGESARMGGIDGTLVLRLTPRPGGCRIEAEGVMAGRGPLRYAAAAAAKLAGPVAASDLRRVGRVLSTRGPGG
jgi:uncharacterized protein YndB with AHSA1/START domain